MIRCSSVRVRGGALNFSFWRDVKLERRGDIMFTRQKFKKLFISVLLLSFGAIFINEAYAYDNEVWESSGTYYWKINGSQAGNSSSLSTAINSCMGSNREVHVLTGGSLDGTINVPASNVKLYCHNNTFTRDFSGWGIKNSHDGFELYDMILRGGSDGYGIRSSGASHLKFINIEIYDCPWIGIRVDSKSSAPWEAWISDLEIKNVMVDNCGDHGIETYSIDGVDMDSIVVRNCNSCGLLLNRTKNGTIGTVNAYNCSWGSGYAGLRYANACEDITTEKLIADRCGRGFFIVQSGPSVNCHLNNAEIYECSDMGIWIENGTDCSVESGCCESSVSVSGSGSYANVGSSCDGFSLTINTTGSGSVSCSPDNATYAEGTSVELTAEPESGWEFDSWSGDGVSGSDNPLTITMNSARSITAVFSDIPVTDCAGVEDGNAYVDSCGQCVGGTTGQEPCQQDCNGDWGGDAYLDDYGICVGGETGLEPFTGAIEGEDATDYDGVIESDNTGYTGDGYINYTNEAGASAVWSICSDSSFSSEIAVRYSNGSGTNRNLSVSVNGNQQTGDLEIPPTDSWTDWKNAVVSVSLTEGENQLELVSLSSDGGPNIDIIGFSNSGVHVCQTNTKELRQNKQSGDMGILYSKGKISLRLKRQKKIQLGIYSISGRKVADLFKGRASVGLNLIEVDETGLTNGLYILILKDEGGVVIRQRLRFID